jgi:hypothetical protein
MLAVLLRGLASVMHRLFMMAASSVRVMSGFLVMASIVVLGGFIVMGCCLLMMFGCFSMMLCGLFRHNRYLLRVSGSNPILSNYNVRWSNRFGEEVVKAHSVRKNDLRASVTIAGVLDKPACRSRRRSGW